VIDLPAAVEQRSLCDGTVLTVLAEKVLTVSLNRPAVHNAMTLEQVPVVTSILEEASERLDVRAVVLQGTGEHFCTGADLRAVAGAPRPGRPAEAPAMTVGDAARAIRTGWQRMVTAVLECEKPVVAAVRGNVAGGGLPLALACDLVLAGDSTRFTCVFARRGLVPDAGSAYLLTRLIGPQRAKQLAFLADPVPAAEAFAMGLVNAVVPDTRLDEEVRLWTARLAAGPTKALAYAKHLINRSLESDRTTSFLEESLMAEMVIGSDDFRSAAKAFATRAEDHEFRGW
jgi:2-(1,2-epoxy-1,2-dihydrophenyl)acetyl-CoA isomerase